MHMRRSLLFCLALSLGIAHAATLTIQISGTPGPRLSGSDPLNIQGQSAAMTITASETLTPSHRASNYVSYSLPRGAVSVSVIGITLTNTSNATMSVKLTATADILSVQAPGPLGVNVTMTAFLAPGSWTKSVFQHPTAFTPSPQTLTPAMAPGPNGSQIKYVFLGSQTVLGFSGSASDSSAARNF